MERQYERFLEKMPSETTVFDLLTVKEVAAVLHCSKAHVCNVIAGRVDGCKAIPVLRMGRRLLVRRDSLERWIEDSENASLAKTKR